MTAKHFAILILGFLIPGLGFAKQTVEIHIDNGYVPYSYVGDGQLKGPYVQILETASLALKIMR